MRFKEIIANLLRFEPEAKARDEQTKQEALQMLKQSGVIELVLKIKEEKWPIGRILTQSFRDNEEEEQPQIGVDLIARSGPVSGSSRTPRGWYEGDGFIVRADVESNSIVVFSKNPPVEIKPNYEEGWNLERKLAVQRTITEASENPVRYRRADGMAKEDWSEIVTSPLIKR